VPIFSRRVLQRLLVETQPLLSPSQHERWVSLLNAADERALDTEWEVAITCALAKCGVVRYEPALGGKTRPDLLYSGKNLSFVADIASVNDSGYEKANKRISFERELWGRVRSAGLSPAGFRYEIKGEERKGKMRLLLPSTDDWSELFDQNFSNLLAWVRVAPDRPVALRRQGAGFDVSFWYTPGVDSVTSGHPTYRYSKILTKTPIYNALKRKKEQLKACGYDGLLGIILCDGDCNELRAPEHIVRRFFRDTSAISFVVRVVLSGDRFSRRQEPIRLDPKCYFNSHVDGKVAAQLRELFESAAPDALPVARDDVVNALNYLRWKKQRVGLSHEGGFTFWGGRYMRISSRALHELLAGEMTSDRFHQLHRFKTDGDKRNRANPFLAALLQGRMIADVWVERDEDEDDDWVVFEFGNKDPAISGFEVIKDANPPTE